ncbi:MAG: TfoX/Sxy family protein [Pseudomonadota bacterium]|nr:TfoX/Sxy family protein [Pseudomonadota bacterium]
MPTSNEEKEFVSYVVDLMQSVGPVHAKGMFGGHGIYLEGLMFGLVANGVLYLKVDKETESEFKDRGLEAFAFSKKGKEFKMSYYEAPEETLENSEEMSLWANKAYGAALRAASRKEKK